MTGVRRGPGVRVESGVARPGNLQPYPKFVCTHLFRRARGRRESRGKAHEPKMEAVASAGSI